MDNKTADSQKKKYVMRRTLKRVSGAVLLFLLLLAFIGIRMSDAAGAEEASGKEEAQEAVATALTAEASEKEEAQEAVATALTAEASEKEEAQETVTASMPAEASDADAHGDSAELFTLSMVPPYAGCAYADINGDIPFFTQEEMTSDAFHEYWPLDDLGRCTGAYACVGPETLPTQKRGDISSVKPTGWNTNRYSDIDGELLFNRCHLIGHMLTGQDANERNLITGTRYMNVEGMLPFEESVAMYVEGTGNHVLYRVRPYFVGDNLVCSGVLMEARSVEDPLVQFCAFCYNVQPGFEIDYATGDNRRAEKGQSEEAEKIVADPNPGQEAGLRRSGSEEEAQECTYILNTNTHKFHMPYCDSVKDMKEKNKKETTLSREELIMQGYSPCKRCNP